MLQKNKIKNSFDRASASYDKVAGVQKECSQILATMLQNNFPQFQPDKTLDLGTGTGYMAKLTSEMFPLSYVTLNDISMNMLHAAMYKLQRINIRCIWGDMEGRDFGFHDLITANLSLQWTNNLNKMMQTLYRDSKILAFSCLLDGTFYEWAQKFTRSPVPPYPTLEEITAHIASLNPKNYFLDTKDFTLEFENDKAFVRYLRDLGAIACDSDVSIGELRRIFKATTSSISITYRVFFAVIER